MTSRERFRACMDRTPTDRVPFDIGSTAPMTWLRNQRQLVEFLGLPGEPRPVGHRGFDERIMEWAGVDFRGVGWLVKMPSRLTRADRPGCSIDCWGIRHEMIAGEAQITENPLRGADAGTLDDYPWPQPVIPEVDLETWVAEAKRLREEDRYVVLAQHPVLGIMELGCWMFGYDEYLYNLAAEPDLIRRFNDIVLDIQLRITDQYYAALGPYIDLTISGDDFGMQQGPLVSPQMFADLIVPWFRERIRRTKEVGDCIYWHHSCGSIYELLDQIIDCGVEIINPVQTSASKMDPATLKAGFGDRVVFWGAMDVQQFLPSATPDEVREHTRELVRVLGEGGGYVMAPAHEIGTDIPPANLVAWVEEMKAIESGGVL